MPRHQPVFNLRRAHMNTDHLGDLAAPIHATRARPARRLALAQTDDQLLTQLTHWQGIDRVVDRLATDVGISQVGYVRSEEHTSELQSLMRISYAVFCLKKKNKKTNQN